MKPKKLLGLVMIVKNEAARIASVLRAYAPFIDVFTILDTGSTDGTQDIVRAFLATPSNVNSILSNLYEEPFVDFSTSRNRVLELHGERTTFVMMSNLDDLVGGEQLVRFLEEHRDASENAYRIRISPGHYYQTRVLRSGTGWRYRGRTHEVVVGEGLGQIIPNVRILRDRDHRTALEWRERWQRDVALLRQDIADDPQNARAVFYLAQTFECLENWPNALALYTRRAEMVGYIDETYEAKFRRGRVLAELGRCWESDAAYLEAHAFDPRRAEPLYAIAKRWHELDNHALTYLFARRASELPLPETDLFVDADVYAWKAADLVAVHA